MTPEQFLELTEILTSIYDTLVVMVMMIGFLIGVTLTKR